MTSLSSAEIKRFQKEILDWYAVNQRDLPWRKTRDPYRILVSEIMLQQTQVNRVIPKYEAWFNAFPTVHDLAKAPVSEVLRLWSGLGYNRRALNLKKTAVEVSETYDGKFPKTEKELLAFPGIGLYTTRAIMCFAFNEQVAVVDTNVRKVILTKIGAKKLSSGIILHDGNQTAALPSMTDKEILSLAEQLLPNGKAYEWNQALMDYSNLVLKKEKIHIPKQTRFHGSRRYYRGLILKQLLQKKTIAIKELGSLIKENYSPKEKAWLDGLVDELVKEGFIMIHDRNIQLAG